MTMRKTDGSDSRIDQKSWLDHLQQQKQNPFKAHKNGGPRNTQQVFQANTQNYELIKSGQQDTGKQT